MEKRGRSQNAARNRCILRISIPRKNGMDYFWPLKRTRGS